MNVAKVGVRLVLESPAVPPDIESVVTFHVRRPDAGGPWSALDLEELGGRVWNWWASEFDLGDGEFPLRRFYPDFLRLAGIDCWPIQPAEGDPVTYDPGDAEERYGDGQGAAGPPQLAFVLGLRTDTDTRRGRGRIYLPTFSPLAPAAGGVIGYLDETTRTRIAHVGSNLIERIQHDPLELEIWGLVVYSRVAETANAVLSFSVPDRVATQRRRCARPVQHAYDVSGDPI